MSATRIVTREALSARPLPVARVAAAFGARGGCYVRGYTDAELERFCHAATRGGQLDGDLLRQVTLAQCLLASPAPDGPRWLGPEPEPTREQVARLAELPMGSLARLEQIADDLAGLTAELQVALAGGATFLSDDPTLPLPEGEFRLASLDELLSEARGVGLAASVCGELGGLWVRAYTAAEKSAAERLGTRGRERSPRRARWALLADCLLTGPEPDSPPLVDASLPAAERMAWVARHLWPGEQLRLERCADVLSGWGPAEAEILRTSERAVPLASTPSDSGLSTG